MKKKPNVFTITLILCFLASESIPALMNGNYDPMNSRSGSIALTTEQTKNIASMEIGQVLHLCFDTGSMGFYLHLKKQNPDGTFATLGSSPYDVTTETALTIINPSNTGIRNIAADRTTGAEKFVVTLEKGFFTTDTTTFSFTTYQPELSGTPIDGFYAADLIHGGDKFIVFCKQLGSGKFFLLEKTQTGTFNVGSGGYWATSYFGSTGPDSYAVATGAAPGLGMLATSELGGKIILSSDNLTDGVKEITHPTITFQMKNVAYAEGAEMYVFAPNQSLKNMLVLVPRTSIDSSTI